MAPAFVCDDPTTWPEPADTWSSDDPQYGQVQLQAWSGLHAIAQRRAQRGTRTQPRPPAGAWDTHSPGGRAPAPPHQGASTALVLVVGPIPPNWAEVWQAYVARYSIEHTFRFFKQALKWTTPNLRQPGAVDRWTWLLLLAYVQLRLARDQVVDARLLWQRPLPPELAALLAHVARAHPLDAPATAPAAPS
jgi:hypothetical protein